MNHLKIFEDFIEESTTDTYEPPKFVVKPAKNDTGYELVRKRYHRFLWVTPQLGKGVIDKGENPPITEAAYDDFIDRDSFNPAEISGMGRSQDFPGGKTAGYTKNTGTDYLPSEYYEDPDEKKKRKLKKIIDFEDFLKGDEPEK
jgi:hypothetical protein